MTKDKLLLWFLASGGLLGISFPGTGGMAFLIFFALIPMLIAEHTVYEKRWRARLVLWYSYPGFILFNVITTWWILNATVGGMIMAVLLNAFLMSVFFWLFHLFHRRYGHYLGYTAFVCLWMSFEYFHYNWELAWPWLNFGNVFSANTQWVQWYEYTGVGGGTLWVLLANLVAFIAVKHLYMRNVPGKKLIPVLGVWLAVILLPLIGSLVIYNNYEEKKDPIDVVVVQPNIDPYGDKFGGMSAEDQLIVFLRQAFLNSDSTVDFIVGPETALPYSINENKVNESEEVQFLKNAFKRMRKTSIVIGMSSHRIFPKGAEKPENARELEDGNFVEWYNSALFLPAASDDYSVYHKSKLVLGVEKVPFTTWLPFLENLALDMGGTVGSLGVEKEAKVFRQKNHRAVIAPSVCYESIFGEHMAAFVKKGANVIFVVTNDGWWGDTPGYKQHINFERLTCISLRRSIAQSANTGLSGFIDQRGDILWHTDWWTPTALRKTVNLNDEITFYAKHGDYLYRTSLFFAVMSIVLYLYAYFSGKNFVNSREV